MEIEQRSSNQLGDASASTGMHARSVVEWAVVGGLDELEVGIGQQRTNESGNKGGCEGGEVGVYVDDDVAARCGKRPPQRFAFAGNGGQLRTGRRRTRSTEAPADRATSAVSSDGPRVDHDQLVDERAATVDEIASEGVDDETDRGCFVERWQHHTDPCLALAAMRVRGQAANQRNGNCAEQTTVWALSFMAPPLVSKRTLSSRALRVSRCGPDSIDIRSSVRLTEQQFQIAHPEGQRERPVEAPATSRLRIQRTSVTRTGQVPTPALRQTTWDR